MYKQMYAHAHTYTCMYIVGSVTTDGPPTIGPPDQVRQPWIVPPDHARLPHLVQRGPSTALNISTLGPP